MAYLTPSRKTPWWLRLLIAIGDWAVGKRLAVPRVLAHHPRSLLAVGGMEALVTHRDTEVSARQLQLVRLQVSLTVACPFCVDMNAQNFLKNRITQEELEALQGLRTLESVPTFSEAERTVARYVASLCSTPVSVTEEHVRALRRHFSERAVVILATTAAQVNLWTRLIQGLGLPIAGFTPNCSVKLEIGQGGRSLSVEVLKP